jgi:histidinol-phosphate aminotransferase
MYRTITSAFGMETIDVPLDEAWDLKTQPMLEALERYRPSLVFYSRPNNPTGNCFTEERLRAVIESDPGALHVIDEVYGPFAGQSLTGWCERYPNVAVLGSLSKIGLAGVRVGWIRLHPELRREVDKARLPFNVSALSQEVARLALSDLAPTLEAGVHQLIRERHRVIEALRALPGVTPYPTDASFLLVRLPCDATAFVAELAKQSIAVCNLDDHSGRLRGHVRITIGEPNENDRLLDAFPRALAPVADRSFNPREV